MRHLKCWLGSLCLTFAVPAFAQEVVLPPAEAGRADINVLVVRHAQNACGDLQCALTERGQAQASALARLVARAREAGLQLAGVYASSACRTIQTATPTANDAALPVLAYPARDAAPVCGYLGAGDEITRPGPELRPVAGLGYAMGPATTRVALMDEIARAAEVPHRRALLYVIVDHSNFVCTWFARFGAPEADYAGECGEDGLDQSDFADIYWLYDTDRGPGAAWRLRHYEDAFDVAAP
jgi:hypothetical protein